MPWKMARPGVPTLSDRHFVRDLVGSTVTVIDVARAAVASNLPTLNAALVEQDAYLAYGDRLSASAMTLKTDTDNRYRFNGKERHDWAGYPYIDYGARMYNPVIGSWLSPDPLADKYTSTSPYVFCAGDPVNYVDPTGMDWIMACYDGEMFLYYDEEIHNQQDIISKYYNGEDRKKYDIAYVGEFASYQSSDGTGFSLNSDGSYTDKEGNTTFEEYADDGVLHIGNSKNTVQRKGRNWYGTYTGSRNPEYIGPRDSKDSDKKTVYSYAKPPIDALDYAAYKHDKEYDKLGAEGLKSVFFQMNTYQADVNLIVDCVACINNHSAPFFYTFTTIAAFELIIGNFKIPVQNE